MPGQKKIEGFSMRLLLYAAPLKKASKHIVQYVIINSRLRKVATFF